MDYYDVESRLSASSRALLDLHQAVFERLAGPGMPALLDDLLLPDRWMPHVTLAGHLDVEQLVGVVRTCVDGWQPIRATAMGLGLRIHPDVTDARRVLFGG